MQLAILQNKEWEVLDISFNNSLVNCKIIMATLYNNYQL